MCFRLVETQVTWSEARAYCQLQHADLFELDTMKRIDFLENLLSQHISSKHLYLTQRRKKHLHISW